MENRQVASEIMRWMDMAMHRAMRDLNRYLRQKELSMPQFGILMQLHHGGPSAISEMGRWEGVSKAAASQIVERLVEKKYIERTEDTEDRRIKRIDITAQGRELVKSCITERFRWVGEAVAGLSADGKERVGAALPDLIRAFEGMKDSANDDRCKPVHARTDTGGTEVSC